jgi:hypothetical protein
MFRPATVQHHAAFGTTIVSVLHWSQLQGGKGEKPAALLYLLSNDVGIVGGFSFEGAVVGPEIDRGGDARDTTLVDLTESAPVLYPIQTAHHIPYQQLPSR